MESSPEEGNTDTFISSNSSHWFQDLPFFLIKELLEN
jgi:hypothetical protein